MISKYHIVLIIIVSIIAVGVVLNQIAITAVGGVIATVLGYLSKARSKERDFLVHRPNIPEILVK